MHAVYTGRLEYPHFSIVREAKDGGSNYRNAYLSTSGLHKYADVHCKKRMKYKIDRS